METNPLTWKEKLAMYGFFAVMILIGSITGLYIDAFLHPISRSVTIFPPSEPVKFTVNDYGEYDTNYSINDLTIIGIETVNNGDWDYTNFAIKGFNRTDCPYRDKIMCKDMVFFIGNSSIKQTTFKIVSKTKTFNETDMELKWVYS